MRILDIHDIEYNIISYDNKDGKIDGISVAKKIGKDLECVFKTLVVGGNGGKLYVFVIPVNEELNLKRAAKACGEKKLAMIPSKDIKKHTGYIRGGCSPIGMKKDYPTFIDKSAFELKTMVVSGGRIGIQIELAPEVLKTITDASIL